MIGWGQVTNGIGGGGREEVTYFFDLNAQRSLVLIWALEGGRVEGHGARREVHFFKLLVASHQDAFGFSPVHIGAAKGVEGVKGIQGKQSFFHPRSFSIIVEGGIPTGEVFCRILFGGWEGALGRIFLGPSFKSADHSQPSLRLSQEWREGAIEGC
jgi:hypothetical protein